jgi:hypothetical protein
MPTATTSAFISAHTHEGIVWQARGNKLPSTTGMAPMEYARTLPADAIVRVAALRDNDELIALLGVRATTEHDFKLQIGRLSVINWQQVKACGPAHLLMTVQSARYGTTSTGNWRSYTPHDMAQAALAMAVASDDNAMIMVAMANHPVYSAMSFVKPLDFKALAALVVAIRDPRWHIDPEDPDSDARLMRYLGLVPERNSRRTGGQRENYALAKRAWRAGFDGVVDGRAPGSFVWRRWAAISGPPHVADLAATGFFVSYLRTAWLDAVSHRSNAEGFQGPLVPSIFFQDEPVTAEALAYHLGPRHLRVVS